MNKNARTRWILTLTLCAVQFVDVLGVTVVVVALPSMQADLAMSGTHTAHVASAYALCFGSFLVLAGRMADMFGTSRLLIAGLLIFLAGSIAGGASGSGFMLIAARAVQGVGAAVAVPAALAIIVAITPEGPHRSRALGVWTAAGAVGGAAGFAVGGVVTEFLTWRWLFLLPMPLIAVSLIAVTRHAPAVPREAVRARPRIDAPDALLLPAGMFALIGGLTNVQTHDLAEPMVVLPLLVGAGLLGAFFVSLWTGGNTLIPISVVARPNLRIATLVAFTLTFVTSSAAVLITLWLQDVRAMSAGRAGLLLLFSSAGVVAGSAIGSKLLGATTTRWTMGAGLGALFAASVGQIGSLQAGSVTGLGACFALSGMGLGCASVAATDHGLQSDDAGDNGVASGILSSAAPIGTAVGIPVLTTIAAVVTDAIASSSLPAPAGETAGPETALAAGLILQIVTMSLVWLRAAPIQTKAAAAHDASHDGQRGSTVGTASSSARPIRPSSPP